MYSGEYKNVDFELKQLVSESLVGDGVADRLATDHREAEEVD